MILFLIESIDDWLSRIGLRPLVTLTEQLEFRVFAAGLFAFIAVLVFGRPTIRWLALKKIGDRAQFDVAALDKALESKANTPTMGGMLLAAAVMASTLLFADLGISTTPEESFGGSYVRFALIVILWMGVLGGVDDWLKLTASSRPGGSRQGLYAWEKLIFQLGIGALIGYFAWSAGHSPEGPSLAHVVNLPLQKTFENAAAPDPVPGLFYLGAGGYMVIMTLMMAGMSNAVNITDGMDGLASGITVAVSVGLVVLCIIAGSSENAHELLVPYVATSGELAVVAAALAGACLGFLWFNCSPAAVFMGDTGSLLLGGLIGYIAVVIRQEIVVLIMAGVFVVEIASVVMQVGWFKYTKRRTGEGRRIFRCAPFHWHLQMGGWSEQKVVARLWIIAIVLVGIGLATLKFR